MSRTIIPIPLSQFQTRIEVYYKGELNRFGSVQSGATEAKIRLPADISECEIRIIPCDSQGKPAGRSHVYKDETLVPEPPVHIDPPAECPEDASEDVCCGKPEECEGTTESSEIEIEQSPDVQLVRATGPDSATVEPAPEPGETIGPDDRVYKYNTDDEGRLDSVDDVTDEYEVEDEEDKDDE